MAFGYQFCTGFQEKAVFGFSGIYISPKTFWEFLLESNWLNSGYVPNDTRHSIMHTRKTIISEAANG